MTVEITSVSIGAEKITIEAINLEDIFTKEDLFEDFETSPVTFEFDRHAKGGAALKYLYKVCQSQNRCKQEKSMGAKLEKLCGVITHLSEAFKVQ